MGTPSRRGSLAGSLALACALVACGGGSDDAGPGATDPADAPAAAEPAASTDTAADVASDDGAAPATDATPVDAEPDAQPDAAPAAGAKRATVTIGDRTYEADLSGDFAVCISMGGAIAGSGPIDGLEDATIDIDVPPTDYLTSDDDGWDPPSVRVDLGEDDEGVPVEWEADELLAEFMPAAAGKSVVDSFTSEGGRAAGTGVFIDSFQLLLAAGGSVDEPQPVSGTWSIDCS